MEDASKAARSSADDLSAVALMQKWSRTANGKVLLVKAAEQLKGSKGDDPWVARDVARLASGRAMSPQLKALATLQPMASGEDLWRKATAAVATRSLLVLCHCRFNGAFRKAAKASSVRRGALGLSKNAAAAHQRFQRLEASIQTAAASENDAKVRKALWRAAEAYSQQLPVLAEKIAPAAYLARVARNRDAKDAINKDLGRSTLEATNILREGIAAYCACIELLTNPERVHVLGSLSGRPVVATAAKPQVLSDRGKSSVPRTPALRSGREVVVEGYVTGTTAWRGADGKLHSLVQLLSPISDQRVNGVCRYLHLEHRGVVPGAYVRMAGTFRSSSKLAKGKPAVEIAQWDQTRQKRKSSWHSQFLSLAEAYFPVFPNGNMLAWSIGPHRVSLAKSGKSFWGAGETVWPPVARGWSKEYER